eukprot:3078553-Lingulodinium_polyedra.AAC.1
MALPLNDQGCAHPRKAAADVFAATFQAAENRGLLVSTGPTKTACMFILGPGMKGSRRAALYGELAPGQAAPQPITPTHHHLA